VAEAFPSAPVLVAAYLTERAETARISTVRAVLVEGFAPFAGGELWTLDVAEPALINHQHAGAPRRSRCGSLSWSSSFLAGVVKVGP
jgi:hypothetical protein